MRKPRLYWDQLSQEWYLRVGPEKRPLREREIYMWSWHYAGVC